MNEKRFAKKQNNTLKAIKNRATRALYAEKHLIQRMIAPFFKTTPEEEKKHEAHNLSSPLVVVLSRSLSYSTGLSVIRALGEAGYAVDYITIKGFGNFVVKSSKYVQQYIEVEKQGKRAETEEKLLKNLIGYLEKHNHKPVLIPVDGYMVSFVDRNRSILENIFHIPRINSEEFTSLTEYMDKPLQRRVALTAGMAVAREWVVSLTNLSEIPDEIPYPCFCKPIQISSGNKGKAVICANKQDLVNCAVVLQRNKNNADVLIEEILPTEQEFVISGVCFDQNIIIPGVIKKTIVSKRAEGNTVAGQMLPIESLGGICANVKQMLKSYCYTGMFNLELNYVNGQFYFLGLKFHCEDSSFAYFCNGVNLPELYVGGLLTHSQKQEKEIGLNNDGRTFINERVAFDEWINGFSNLSELRQRIGQTDDRLLKYDTDPKPWEEFSRKLVPYMVFRTALKQGYKTTKHAINQSVYIPLRTYRRNILDSINGYPISKRGISDNLITEQPTAVVLSRNYTVGLTAVRLLGAAGLPVDLVSSAFKTRRGTAVAASSRYVRNYVEVVSRKVKSGQDRRLLRQLLKYSPESPMKPVLFPTDDYTAFVMDQNRDILSDRFLMPCVSDDRNGAMTICMDKSFQSKLAGEAGLLIPREWNISLGEGIKIPEDLVYPCFVKPIAGYSGNKTEIAKCDDEDQLIHHLEKMEKRIPDRSVLIQEYLDINEEISISGVCLDQEIVIPGIIRKTKPACCEREAASLFEKLEPFEMLGDLCEPVLRMLRSYHYQGMFEVELNHVGDKVYFNEVNLISGEQSYFYYLNGVNLPALYVKAVLGQQRIPEEENIKRYGGSFVSEKTVWEDFLRGCLTRQEMNKLLAETEQTLIKVNDDLRPWIVFKRLMKYKQISKSLRSFKVLLKKLKREIKRRTFSSLRNFKYILFRYPQTKKKNQRNSNTERPRILVVGRNYCSNLCMARSFGKAGYEVEVLRVFHKKQRLRQYLTPEAYSKYVKAYYVCVTNRKNSRLVQKLEFLADSTKKMLLIPCDDFSAEIIDDNYEQLKQYYLIPNVQDTQGGISHLMSKEVQKQLAIEAGLPVVNGCMIVADHGEFEIPETVSYPCFLKPNISKNGSKKIMRRCDTEEELIEALTKYSRRKRVEILVEDYLEIKTECSLLGLSTKEKVIGPGFFAAEQGGHVGHRGVAMTGIVLSPSVHQKLVDQLIQFISTLQYEGLYDVDLIETTDGRIFFVELNFRYGGSGYAITESGLNLPGMFADYMIFGKPVDENCSIPETGKHFISELVMIDEYKEGFLKSLSEIRTYMDHADIHFIKNKTDPWPYRHFSMFYPFIALKRRVAMIS